MRVKSKHSKGKTAGNDWLTFSYHDSTVSMNTNGVSMLKKFVFALAFTMWWKVECQSFKFFLFKYYPKNGIIQILQ